MAAANSKAYGGGMFIAPDAELDDGLLDVVCDRRGRQAPLPRGLPKVFDGAHVRNPEVTVSRAAEARVEADRPFAVYADGDHIADLPATVRHPAASAAGDRAAMSARTARGPPFAPSSRSPGRRER